MLCQSPDRLPRSSFSDESKLLRKEEWTNPSNATFHNLQSVGTVCFVAKDIVRHRYQPVNSQSFHVVSDLGC
jgi:hypothetical protein